MAVALRGLKPRREALGMRQEDLAQRLFVNRAAVSMWERGAALPRAELLPAIAKQLQCSIDELYNDCSGVEVKSPCPTSA